jgi:hypothetical protein
MGKRKRQKVRDIELNVMSNKPTKDHYDALQQFYVSFANNQIALMEAKIEGDEDETCDLLLVHQEYDPTTGKILAIPVAKVFGRGESRMYVAPDGKGGWLKRPSDEINAGTS